MIQIRFLLQGGPHDGKSGTYVGPPTVTLYATEGDVAHVTDNPSGHYAPGPVTLVYTLTDQDDYGVHVYTYDPQEQQ